MRYRYVAVNEAGKRITGQASGTEQEVMRNVRDRGWVVVSLQPEQVARRSGQTLKDADLELVFSRLAYLVKSGVKIDKAVALLARGSLPEGVKGLVEDISSKLNQGSTLHAALEDYRNQIDNVYLASIRLGEEIGGLGNTFEFIAESLQARIRLRKDIQKATIYPAAVLTFSVMSLFFIFNFIVPRITGIFKDAESIPWYTSMLMSASQFTIDYQFHILALLGGVVVLAVWLMRQPESRAAVYPWLFRLPVIKGFLLRGEQIRFCSAMGLALGSGLLVYNAIRISAETVRNPVARHSLLTAAREIGEGRSASEALTNAHFLPEFHASLLEVSQDREALRDAFADIAQRLEEELSGAVGRLLVLLEPALIGIMGIIIGGIVLIMMMSILSIQSLGF